MNSYYVIVLVIVLHSGMGKAAADRGVLLKLLGFLAHQSALLLVYYSTILTVELRFFVCSIAVPC